MKYAVLAATDGNYNIHSEHENLTAAIIEHFGYVRALWADTNTTNAMVAIVDENLDVVGHYKECIQHEPVS